MSPRRRAKLEPPHPALALLSKTRGRVTLDRIRTAAGGCQACPLWEHATGTVFGEGPVPAELMLVGEEPGDQEDKQGHVFVGPAGRLMDRLLERAGLRRETLYLTNAVKHFKWKPKGKRRIHQTPGAREIAACRPWLLLEIARVKPRVVVLMGAVAAQSLLGSKFKVTERRGELLDMVSADWRVQLVATLHPSAVLRVEDAAERRRQQAAWVADLVLAREALDRAPRAEARALGTPG